MDDYRLDSNLGDDSSEFAKAFTAEYYVPTESETIEVARQSWIQFAEKSKQLVVVVIMTFEPFDYLSNRFNRLTTCFMIIFLHVNQQMITRLLLLPSSIKPKKCSIVPQRSCQVCAFICIICMKNDPIQLRKNSNQLAQE
jgi:hypothetical protein